MLIKYLKLAMVLLSMVILSGCATPNIYVQKDTPIKSSLAAYETVLVSVQAKDASIAEKDGFDARRMEFEQLFVEKLAATQKFKKVLSADGQSGDSNTLGINLIIEEFEDVSGGASVIFGVFAGNAKLKVLAKISDTASKEVLGELRSGAGTSSSAGIFRGSTSTLIEEITNGLVAEIATYK